jgi:hypothetical protein
VALPIKVEELEAAVAVLEQQLATMEAAAAVVQDNPQEHSLLALQVVVDYKAAQEELTLQELQSQMVLPLLVQQELMVLVAVVAE